MGRIYNDAVIFGIELGYSTTVPPFTLDERRRLGEAIEKLLAGEKEAARAPPRD